MDEDKRRREYILNIILIGSIVMLVILDGIVLFHSLREGSRYHDISFGTFSLLPAFFILLYLLSRRGFSGIASYLLITAYFASDSYAAYRWGVGMQTVLIAYALIIVIATILRGTSIGFFTTSLIAAFIIPLWYAQAHGMVSAHRPSLMASISWKARFGCSNPAHGRPSRNATKSLFSSRIIGVLPRLARGHKNG